MGTVRIRDAQVEDAPAMGRVMVESFVSAHPDQIPAAAFQKRVTEWTPEVSARGWARTIAEVVDGNPRRDVVLVAEDDEHGLVGLVSGGSEAEGDDPTGTVSEIGALYVSTGRRGEGIGASLLRTAAGSLAALGFVELRIGVLTANLPARAFYEAMGGREFAQSTIDEEGYPLPLTIYAWADLTCLDGDGSVGTT